MIPQWLVPPKPKLTGTVRVISEEEEARRAEAEFKARLRERERTDKLLKQMETVKQKAQRVKMTKQQKALAECARLGETMEERRHRLQTEWYARNIEKRRARSLEYYHRTKKLANAPRGQD